MKTISNLVTTNKIEQYKLNLIVSGTGTGKSYFALINLLPQLNELGFDIKAHEVLFVTSRRLTVDQQSIDKEYLNYATEFTNNHKDLYGYNTQLLGFGEKVKTTNLLSPSKIDSKIPIVTYNTFANILKLKHKRIPKLIIFDEIHSLYSDFYNDSMSSVIDFIFKNINTNVLLIGMTATPDILKFHKTIVNNLLEEPFYKYKVTDKLITISNKYLHNIITKNTIIMTSTVEQAFKLQSKLSSNSKVLISKYNKEYTQDMKHLMDYIVSHKKLPDDCEVLIATSCAREGFEFKPSHDFEIDTVVVYGGAITDIVQFTGRYRGNIKNLILVDCHKKKHFSKPLTRHVKQCEYLNKLHESKVFDIHDSIDSSYNDYLKELSKILSTDIEFTSYFVEDAMGEFYDWFKENWTNRLIYIREHKNEIVAKSTALGIRQENRQKHTFISLVGILKEEFEMVLDGSQVRKSSITNFIQENEIIEKNKLSPYFFK